MNAEALPLFSKYPVVIFPGDMLCHSVIYLWPQPAEVARCYGR